MSKLNKRMIMRHIVSKNIRKIMSVCLIAMLVTTLATTNSNEQPENTTNENIEVEEAGTGNLVAGSCAILSEVLSLERAQVIENETLLLTSTSTSTVLNDYPTLNIEVENESNEVNEETVIEENIENEETAIEEEEAVIIISEYWPVTEDQLTSYFGYVPEDWELAYWEATVMAECGLEPEEGIKAVADCIGYIRTNTDDRFPDTIYEVITQKNQFSTWKNGAINKWLGNIYENVHAICVNQIQNGASYDAAFFTAGEYNKYCIPGFVIGNHYFGY